MKRLRSHKATLFIITACLFGFFFQLALNPSGLIAPPAEKLLASGANFAPLTIGEHQTFRLLSAIFLHCGIIHLILNLLVLVSFGPTIEEMLGRWRFIFIFFYSALMGNLLSILVNPLNTSVGASGGIMGLIAALMITSWLKRGSSNRLNRPQLLFLGCSLIYSFILGLTSPIVDNACHLGGFLAGALSGLILTNKASGRVKIFDLTPFRTVPLLALVPVLYSLSASATEGNIKVKAYVEQQEGIKLLKEKKYLHGLEHLNNALSLTPENPSILQDRARALIELDQIKPALKDLETVIAQRPKDYIPLMARASANHKLGKDELAVADATEAIRLKPEDAMLYNNRAWFLLASGKMDAALDDCNHALKLNKSLATIYDTRGMAYLLKKDTDSAAKDFDQALKLDEHDGAYYYHRGLTRLAMGDGAGAQDMEKGRELKYKPEAWEPAGKDLGSN